MQQNVALARNSSINKEIFVPLNGQENNPSISLQDLIPLKKDQNKRHASRTAITG